MTLTLRTRVMAAFVARIFGRGRSALGTGGGRAATCGEAALGERFFAVGGLEGVLEGTTTGGVSPSSGDVDEEAVLDLDLEELGGGGAGRS